MWRWFDTQLKRIEANRPFSEPEAWNLFRIVALSEAFGWTILLIGIAWSHSHLPWRNAAVPVAGQIHGTIFLVYFGVVLVTYSSLRWPRRRLLMALAAGVPPYGTLVFEQWAAHRRSRELSRAQFRSTMLAIISEHI